MSSHRYGELSGHNSGSLSERQDSMFDRYLEEMKPYVLRLPQKSGIIILAQIFLLELLVVPSDAVVLIFVVYFCYLFVKEEHKT